MKKLLQILCVLLVSVACASEGPVKVEIKQEGNKFTLLRNSEPYFIKGGAGFSHYDKLKEYGGNSIRLWTTADAGKILDEAHKLGLTVTLGLFIRAERIGFDYNNKTAVKRQFEEIKAEVFKYKDHPALLMWGVGNEIELFAKNMKVWDAVNDICKMIHEVDPNHPTATMLAGVPEDHIRMIKKKAPELDMLAINAFIDLPNVPNKIREAGWKGPYIISEWGPIGYWESKETSWKAFIEETSTEKVETCRKNYLLSIKKDTDKCLGSYVFIWGSKQERTHTLFSIFLQTGQETPMVDLMHYLWTGNWPANKAPVIEAVTVNDKKAKDNIKLVAGSHIYALAKAFDPEKTPVIIKWALFKESNDPQHGGDGEQSPEYIELKGAEEKDNRLNFIVPDQEGAYRLFVYVYDNANKVATANIPLYVTGYTGTK